MPTSESPGERGPRRCFKKLSIGEVGNKLHRRKLLHPNVSRSDFQTSCKAKSPYDNADYGDSRNTVRKNDDLFAHSHAIASGRRHLVWRPFRTSTLLRYEEEIFTY